MLGCGNGATHELLEPGQVALQHVHVHADVFDELSAAVAARSPNDRDFDELRRAVTRDEESFKDDASTTVQYVRSLLGASAAIPPSVLCCGAARTGDVARLRQLHEARVNVGEGDYDRRTPLHIAACEGVVEVAKVLIEECGTQINPSDRWGRTPLDEAILWRHQPMVEYLCSQGALHGTSAVVPAARSGDAPPGAHSTPAGFWVQPEAYERCVRGELLEEPAGISAMAMSMTTEALNSWDNDMLALDAESRGHALYLVVSALFEHYDFYKTCGLNRGTVRSWLLATQACYGGNPYHSSIHGADVALSVHLFIAKCSLRGRLSHLELLAALVAATMHDFNHPGSSNAHEVRCGTFRARAHGESSVLERHHVHSMLELFHDPRFDLLAPLPVSERDATRSLVIELVLATDLAQHMVFLKRMKNLAETHGAAAAKASGTLSPGGKWQPVLLNSELVDSKLLLSMAIKFADLGHVCKPLDLHLMWTERVTQEFWALGDRERNLNMPISPLCDREKDANVAESQVAFFRFICIPFYSCLADLVDPQMLPWLHAQANLVHWQELRPGRSASQPPSPTHESLPNKEAQTQAQTLEPPSPTHEHV